MTNPPPLFIWGSVDWESLVEGIEEQLAAEAAPSWNEGDPPPPWKPPSAKGDLEEYRWAMIDFVEWHLVLQRPDPDMTPIPRSPEYRREQAEWLRNHGPEIEHARRGDIEPLRRRLPHLAEFLHIVDWPKNKRKTGGYPLSFDARLAAEMVLEVRALWARTYDGKWKRKFKPTAEEIVAHTFRIAAGDVKRALKLIQAEQREKAKQG